MAGDLAPVRSQTGVTLVELLVAAVIITVAISGIVALIRTGRELQVSDNHRRQARSYLRATMEQDYDDRNYGSISMGNQSDSVTLEIRPTDLLRGLLTRSVDSTALSTSNGTMIPIRKVHLALSWTEVGGVEDSITFDKYVANAR